MRAARAHSHPGPRLGFPACQWCSRRAHAARRHVGVDHALKPWFAARGIHRVVGLDWWDCHHLPGLMGDVEVVLVPAQQWWSSRGLNDRLTTLWRGFAVFAGNCHLFYAAYESSAIV